MVTLIEHYEALFPSDISLEHYDEDLDRVPPSIHAGGSQHQLSSLKVLSSSSNPSEQQQQVPQNAVSPFGPFARTSWQSSLRLPPLAPPRAHIPQTVHTNPSSSKRTQTAYKQYREALTSLEAHFPKGTNDFTDAKLT
ncbi:Putative LOC100120475 [Caligus rogercresseyi]|uniref:LOC100120475 n=1 Tax=Caligus rogercresseyi TaxID=217165 RepID=A0A7T8GQG6_CALRO|nr:Putative LOC100120475 [Caligus rogercresseyi]